MSWHYEPREIEPDYWAVVEVYDLHGETDAITPCGVTLEELEQDLLAMLDDVRRYRQAAREAGKALTELSQESGLYTDEEKP